MLEQHRVTPVPTVVAGPLAVTGDAPDDALGHLLVDTAPRRASGDQVCDTDLLVQYMIELEEDHACFSAVNAAPVPQEPKNVPLRHSATFRRALPNASVADSG